MIPLPIKDVLDVGSLSINKELTKTNAEELSKRIVVPVLDGDINPLEAHIVAHFLGEVLDIACDKIKQLAIDEALKYSKTEDRIIFGSTFKAYEKKAILAYDNDPVIQDLQNKIKARKKLLDSKHENPEMEIVDKNTGMIVEDVGESRPATTVLQITHGK